MPRDDVEIARQAITCRVRPRRRLEDRLVLRLRPGVVLLAKAVRRLPPSSRLRKGFFRRAVEIGLEAHNRRDLDVAFAMLHEDCESTFPAQMGGLGSASGTHGRKERIAFHWRFLDEWGEYRLEPEELIDAGDRLLVLGRMKGTGRSSGAVFDNEWGLLTTTSAGEIVREQVFLDHREALEAVGLPE